MDDVAIYYHLAGYLFNISIVVGGDSIACYSIHVYEDRYEKL